MLIAESWYESGSFWQFAITTIVAVAVGALAAWATMRSANPKRRLNYGTRTNASLLIASHSQSGALQVTHNGTPVSRPRIVELELRNSGRRDITAAQFHANEPLKFNLGADVVGVLGMASEPSGTIAPSIELPHATPRVIAIPPSLLARKQVFRVALLVDGPRAEVCCVQAPLVDVAVRSGIQESSSRLLSTIVVPALTTAGVVAVFATNSTLR
ncbi:hypothetical protein [Streptomyces luteogriseus]|uniref:Uncharacterized protein n=1 Tax=Streptomyces luteogriseus TaxID=68233 RepID=A0A7W7DP81_9ACTN|nr:hypothetical protein [Streptomyces luteogriseus]MBB4714443.1 hypothetical protein [Streptomyces luteogriseus]